MSIFTGNVCHKGAWLLLSSLCIFKQSAVEYAYPVAWYREADQIQCLVLYQPSPTHTQLWWWDPITRHAAQAVLGTYSPGGVCMLPNGTGFSFIHNDIVYVKELIKRSPKLVELLEPLHSFQNVGWIDPQQYLFAAQRGTKYRVYQASIFGHCALLSADDSCDYLYPQKVHNSIFMIQRTEEGNFSILKVQSQELDQQLPTEETFQERLARIDRQAHQVMASNLSEQVLNFHSTSIAFLHMIDEYEGFVLGHPQLLSVHDRYITCSYHHLYMQDGTWQQKELFHMLVPAYMIRQGDDARLYESILPLLPRYENEHRTLFYFDIYKDTNHADLAVYKYYLADDKKELVLHVPGKHLCGLLVREGNLICGGEIGTAGVHMYFDGEGSVCFDFVASRY